MKHPELFAEIAEYLRTDSIDLKSEQVSLVGVLMGHPLRIGKDSIHLGPISYFGADFSGQGTEEERQRIRRVCELAMESWSRILAERLNQARTMVVECPE